MDFSIGDKVQIKEYSLLPERFQNSGMGKIAGCKGTVTDKLFSESQNCFVYEVQLEGYMRPSSVKFTEDLLVARQEEESTYEYEIIIDSGAVIVEMYRGSELVCRGHSHIMYDGAVGVAQAVSFAMKRIYIQLNGGEMHDYKNTYSA